MLFYSPEIVTEVNYVKQKDNILYAASGHQVFAFDQRKESKTINKS